MSLNTLAQILLKPIALGVFTLGIAACSLQEAKYAEPRYVDSRDYTSFGLDNRDIDGITKKQADSLLSSPNLGDLSKPKIIAISLTDETQEGVDIEIISSELTKHLSGSGKFVVVNMGSNVSVEQIIKKSRGLRDDAEYNQYTTIEEGNLVAPHYALTGKITRKTRRLGDDEVAEYSFLLTLSDLKLGAVRWTNTARIAKRLSTMNVAGFSEKKSSPVIDATESLEPEAPEVFERDETPQISRFSPNGYGESSPSSDAPKQMRNLSRGKNYIVFGADLGVGYNRVNLKNVEFKNTKTSQRYKASDESESDTGLSMPTTFRVGYLRDVGDTWRLGVSLIYSYMSISIEGEESDKYAIRQSDENKLAAQLNRVGGEVVAYTRASDLFSVYFGAGVLKDVASTLQLSLQDSHSIYANKKTTKLDQKINSWYPLAKLGVMFEVNSYLGASMDLSCNWALKKDNAVGLGCFAALGLQVRI